MSQQHVIELSDQNFDDEVLGKDEPMLVACCSEMNYACRETEGIIEDLAAEFAGKVKVGKLDVVTNWQTAEMYGVKHTPMALLFQHDQVVARIEGTRTREEYRQALYELVAQYWVI